MAKVTRRAKPQSSAETLDETSPETPTQKVLRSAIIADTLTDSEGKVYKLRDISPLDEMQIVKALSPSVAQNQPYVQWCILAAGIAFIDNDEVPFPRSELEFEAIIKRMGRAGYEAFVMRGIQNMKTAEQEAKAEQERQARIKKSQGG